MARPGPTLLAGIGAVFCLAAVVVAAIVILVGGDSQDEGSQGEESVRSSAPHEEGHAEQGPPQDAGRALRDDGVVHGGQGAGAAEPAAGPPGLRGRGPSDRRVTNGPATSAVLAERSRSWNDPAPPAAYHGSALEWHLRFHPTTEEIEDYLAVFGKLSRREQLGLLWYLDRRPRGELAGALLEVAPRVPRSTYTLASYAIATSRAAQAVVRNGRDSQGATAEAGVPAQLCLAALKAYGLSIEDQGLDTRKETWAGLRRVLGACESAVRGFAATPAAQALLAPMRRTLEGQLQLLGEPGGVYGGGVEAVALTLDIGDAHTIDILLSVLDNWETARPRFGRPQTRNDTAALSIIGQAVRALAEPPQNEVWLSWVATRLENGPLTPHETQVLRSAARYGTKNHEVPERLRQRLSSALGQAPR